MSGKDVWLCSFTYVDRHNDGTGDLHRSIKASYYRYKEIIANNGL